MTSIEIEGLSAEMRKAVVKAKIPIRTIIYPPKEYPDEMPAELWEEKEVDVLPAALVAQEGQRIKEGIDLLRNEFCSQEPNEDGQGITCDGQPDRERCRECSLIDRIQEKIGGNI